MTTRLVRAVRRLRANPRTSVSRYTPGPTHEAFHRDLSRIRLLRGPNQSGKTQAGGYEACDLSLGIGRYKPARPGRQRGRIVCHSFGQSVAIARKVWEMVPRGELHPAVHFDARRGFRHKWVGFRNGSEFSFVTVGQDTLAHASDTLDWVWIDEPPPVEVYGEALARTMQRAGLVFLTMTPVGAPVGWLRDLVDGVQPEGLDDVSGLEEPEPISEHHYRLTTEACPWMTEAQVAAARAAYPPYMRPQRCDGAWEGYTVGRIFAAMTSDNLVHDVPVMEGWPWATAVQLELAGDHGELAGHSFWVALAYQIKHEVERGVRVRRVRIRAVAEYANKAGADDAEDAEAIRDALAERDLLLEYVDHAVGDVNTAGKSKGGRKLNDEMTDRFHELAGARHFRIRNAWKGSGSVELGVRAVHNLLRRCDLEVDAEHCPMLTEALQHWQGEKTGKLAHRIDALRYGVVDIARREGLTSVLKVP